MEQQCQVCGRQLEVTPWQGDYQVGKGTDGSSVYICPACQDRIQSDARTNLRNGQK